MTRILYLPLFLFLVGNGLQAQVGAPANFSLSTNVTLLEDLSGEQVPVYRDSDNNLLYIDFEQLRVNLKNVVLKNDKGDILLQDDVFSLPVNTIYELKCSDYPPGLYSLELYSFTSVIKRTLRLE